MNSALALDERLSCLPERPEGLLSFLVSRAKSAKRSLAPSASEVLTGCEEAINIILRSAVETRTKADFERAFGELFSKYVALTMAISHFAGAVIQKPLVEQLIRESICELEADFREKGLAAFGAAVRDQAMFTVWTLRKINELTTQIIALPVPSDKKKEDEKFCTRFNLNAIRAQFSLDCLNMSLETKQPIYPEVLEELIDGLRAMVNAYAWARCGLEIRVPSGEPDAYPVSMNEDDAAMTEFAFCEASEWPENERSADAPK